MYCIYTVTVRCFIDTCMLSTNVCATIYSTFLEKTCVLKCWWHFFWIGPIFKIRFKGTTKPTLIKRYIDFYLWIIKIFVKIRLENWYVKSYRFMHEMIIRAVFKKKKDFMCVKTWLSLWKKDLTASTSCSV